MLSEARQTWLAPAKLNLFLHVTGRREDGYHTLQTAFIFLDRYDELQFEFDETGDLSRIDVPGDLNLDLPEQDLCLRAARALQVYAVADENGTKPGVRIYLKKNLAAGAGLGGGSSDAATTLLALVKLWRLNISDTELLRLGAQLGADVPVFLHGENTLAEGIGDIFQPLKLPQQAFCVLIPQIHVSTVQVFSDSSLTRDTPIKTIRGSLPPGLKNDLEAVTCRRYPPVEKALNWLAQFGEARMSGTGASVFLACASIQTAEKILHQRPEGVDGFVAHSLICHPHK